MLNLSRCCHHCSLSPSFANTAFEGREEHSRATQHRLGAGCEPPGPDNPSLRWQEAGGDAQDPCCLRKKTSKGLPKTQIPQETAQRALSKRTELVIPLPPQTAAEATGLWGHALGSDKGTTVLLPWDPHWAAPSQVHMLRRSPSCCPPMPQAGFLHVAGVFSGAQALINVHRV